MSIEFAWPNSSSYQHQEVWYTYSEGEGRERQRGGDPTGCCDRLGMIIEHGLRPWQVLAFVRPTFLPCLP